MCFLIDIHFIVQLQYLLIDRCPEHRPHNPRAFGEYAFVYSTISSKLNRSKGT